MREERLATPALDAGSPDDAYSEGPWTPAFLDAADAALEAYEAEVAALREPSDEEVLAAVERVMLALNAAEEHGHAIDTIDREELCEYIDDVLVRAGIDTDALAERHDLEPGDLGGQWRDW
jgi:hypothetical protein